ncbi:molybdopterin cofactor-binding domain-containing protein, partial [Bordetella pertussis]|uniref:molybdopterin cofactor-binding domain-containing protein n=1 Tax=Bordetella pertussis TaxID=520 RepID=UPI0018A7B814
CAAALRSGTAVIWIVALAQIVAEELDVAFERVEMVLGHTEAAPNQGPTIASAT